jgi:two-component system LytT family sensor kinase
MVTYNKVLQIPGKRGLAHIVCWALLIAYELISARFSYGKLEPWYVYTLFYSLNIAYFYLYVGLLNRTFRGGQTAYVLGFLLWLVLLAAFLASKRVLDHWLYGSSSLFNPLISVRGVIAAYLFRAGYFTVLATFYWVSGFISTYKRLAAQAERRQLVAEKDQANVRNAYLQQQISPHMLFNTLNFIYSAVYRGSPKAGRSVLLLSDILRFGLEAAGADGKIVAGDELQQVRQLIEINRYRYGQNLHLDLRAEGDLSAFRMIPMILLTLTENMFKHGDMTVAGSPATIRIMLSEEGRLCYHSHNLKKPKSEFRRSGGMGLQNVRLRLDHAYPGDFSLDIRETDVIFELILQIRL